MSWGWDGPAPLPGGGVATLFGPTSFVDGSVQGVLGDTPLNDTRLRGNYVLFQKDKETVQVNARLQRFHLGEDIPLTGSPQPVPDDLWMVDFGASYRHKLDASGDWGVIVEGGSNSDHPFHSIHEVVFQLTGTYRLPVDRRHAWLFFLNYSTARSFAPGIPLPGVAYLSIDPGTRTQILYGLPFFAAWQPTDDWNLSLLYLIPTVIRTKISYRFYGPLKVRVGFDWHPQSWLRADRPDTNRRLIFDQKKATAGLKCPIGEDLVLDLDAGFAFDQKFFEAKSLLSRGVTKTALSDGAFVRAEIAYRF